MFDTMSLTRRYTEGILGDLLGVSVMFDTSCPSRDDILKEYSVTDSESV